MQCPKCKTLCTEREMRPAYYEQSKPMIALETEDGRVVLVTRSGADAMGIAGREVWTRREVERRVCPACIEEIRRGGYAHTSPRATWSKRIGSKANAPKGV